MHASRLAGDAGNLERRVFRERRMRKLSDQISEMIERAGELYSTDEFRAWDIEEHRGILAAIRAGDAELAKVRMHDHIVAIGDHYRRVGRI